MEPLQKVEKLITVKILDLNFQISHPTIFALSTLLIPHLSASNVGRRLVIGAAVVDAGGLKVELLNIIGFCGLVEVVGGTGEVGGGGAVGETGTVVPSGPNVGGPFGACVGLVG